MNEYPKWLYGAAGRSTLVATPEAHVALGGTWFESPADVPGPRVVEAEDPDLDPATIAVLGPARRPRVRKTKEVTDAVAQ